MSLLLNKYSKVFLVSFLIPIPKLYSLSNVISMSMYSGLSFLILVALSKISLKKLSRWYAKAFVISLCLLPTTNFEPSAFFWIGWIFLICFAVLQQQSKFKRLRIFGTNLIIFAMLFSVIEVSLRLTENTEIAQRSNPEFVEWQLKKYYQDANALSKSNNSYSPLDEYNLANGELIKSLGDLITINDFDGSFIKIKDGRRVTVGSNGLRQHRVLIFGGSTVFCAEVPDLLTSSSQLQQLILKNNFDFDVLNYGIPGLRIENQFNILKNVNDLGPGDIVVFYDGVNDLIRVFEEGLKRHKNQAPWRQLNDLSFSVEKRSSLFKRLSISGYVDNIGVTNEYLAAGAIQQISDSWLKYDELARELVQKTGADYIHILQPNWLTYKKISKPKSEDRRFSDMQLIQEIFKSKASQNSGILDFTDRLNSLTDTPFLDWVHLDDVGDKKIAEEMFAVLEPMLKAQGK